MFYFKKRMAGKVLNTSKALWGLLYIEDRHRWMNAWRANMLRITVNLHFHLRHSHVTVFTSVTVRGSGCAEITDNNLLKPTALSNMCLFITVMWPLNQSQHTFSFQQNTIFCITIKYLAFGIITFWMKSLMFTKAAFIWSKIQQKQ